jgi:hypothetical protein
MNEVSICSRPPIGFIVEGHGEYESYPVFVSRILGVKRMWIPRINAKGQGGIIKNLEEHIEDIITSCHPLYLIVTVDLVDNIGTCGISNCKDLYNKLLKTINEWVLYHKNIPKLQPLPQNYIVIIQIQKFESWLIADKQGLGDLDILTKEKIKPDWTNVDIDVPNPNTWLKINSDVKIDLKHPDICKKISNKINIDIAAKNSPSFDKFRREIKMCYDNWLSITVGNSMQVEEDFHLS